MNAIAWWYQLGSLWVKLYLFYTLFTLYVPPYMHQVVCAVLQARHHNSWKIPATTRSLQFIAMLKKVNGLWLRARASPDYYLEWSPLNESWAVQTIVVSFPVLPTLSLLRHILTLPKRGQICTVSDLQPFNFVNFQMENPVIVGNTDFFTMAFFQWLAIFLQV